ncbi:30S ribosomal protein S17 [Rickettsiales bacterium (ex Bugula neritina AB1)]|nr:30S ribosomal protein S17 [Rickettsiales bacterium (ex Bugula neritina AB1)]
MNVKQRGKIKGIVVGNKRSKEGTINVSVSREFPHKKYKKIVKKTRVYLVDYPKKENIAIGTRVLLYQIPKVSKNKFLRIETIIE